MPTCPDCGESFSSFPDIDTCPNCGYTGNFSPTTPFDDRDLITIFKADTETEAHLVSGILETAGIPVMIHSLQVPMYDSILSCANACWGDILIHPENENLARELILEFSKENQEETEERN